MPPKATLECRDARGLFACRCIIGGRQIGRGAAFLVALGIIADDADRQVARRFEQQLPAQHPAIAIIDVAAGDDVFQEAVTLHPRAVDTRRDRFAEAAGGIGLGATEIIVANAQLAADFGIELRLGGDDRDEAGRGVAAEQRTLRSAKHLDAVDRTEFRKANARTRAVDAVDEHRDRAFQARVVADGADAADIGTPAPASDEVENTSSDGLSWVSARMSLAPEFCSVSAVTAETASGTSDSASLRRVAVTTISLVSRLPASGSTAWLSTAAASAVAPCGRLGAASVGIGFLGICRHRERDQASRKQPHRLAHLSPPRFRTSCSLGERINRVGGGCKANAFVVTRKTADLRQKCHISQRNMKKARLP